MNLESDYVTSASCEDILHSKCHNIQNQKIEKDSTDVDSRLGTYYRINPLLSKFKPVILHSLTENERILITRFRTGSHSLAIELGRYSRTDRVNRLCVCRQGIQSVWHIFMECPLTRDLSAGNYRNLFEIFDDRNLHNLLLSITSRLKIAI